MPRRNSEAVIPPIGGQIFGEAIVQEKPELVSGPPLVYPTLLQQARIEGVVMIEAIIDTSGRAEPNSVTVLTTANPGFNQNAKNYVLKALFRPARIYGRAVRVLIQLPVEFKMDAH